MLYERLRLLEPEYEQFRTVLHLLVICLADLQAGTMTLSDLIGVNR